MKPLRTLLTAAALLALAGRAHSAWTDDFPLGYDADHKYYFHRLSSFDNSLQLAFDAGLAYYGAALSQPERYRDAGSFSPSTSQLMLGVAGEKNFFKAYCSVSVGASYMMLSTYMFGRPVSRGSGYVVVADDDSAVRYEQAGNVSTATSYISIPVELKYELICNEKFGMYLKGAVCTGINLGTRTYFNARANAAPEVKKQVEGFFANNDPLFVNANAHLGFRFGSYDESSFRLELGVPFPLTGKVANLSVAPGFGFRVSYAVPFSIFSR